MSDIPEKVENINFGSGPAPSQKPTGITLTERQRLCGDIGMEIDPQGQWHYQGSPINRRSLVKLFASVLRRDDAGDYWLITPAEVAPVSVADAPFMVIELSQDIENGEPALRFRTNIDTWVTASAEFPIRVDEDKNQNGEPRPYLRVAADGTEARINRAVFYELAELAEETDIEGKSVLAVKSVGSVFPLGANEET